MSRIFLLLTDPVAAARLRALIDATPAHQTVGCAATLDQARERIAQARPDLVIADLLLADGPFASLLDALCRSARYGQPKSLVLAPSPEHPHLLAALRHGADGFVLATASTEARLHAIEQVVRGEAALAMPIASALKVHFGLGRGAGSAHAETRHAPPLETTERRVLDAMAAGYAEAEVQRALDIGARELGQCVRAIYRKLQAELHAGSEFARQAA